MTQTCCKKSSETLPFTGAARFHTALRVADLQASIRFYQDVFEQPPAKVKQDYAKFDMPYINFTLNQTNGSIQSGGGLSHLGIQLRDLESLAAARTRLAELGRVKYDEKGTSCCYALQDKFWLEDPDGNAVEFFVVLKKDADSEDAGLPEMLKPESCCAG